MSKVYLIDLIILILTVLCYITIRFSIEAELQTSTDENNEIKHENTILSQQM